VTGLAVAAPLYLVGNRFTEKYEPASTPLKPARIAENAGLN
jgi:hypothetical protein